MVLCNPANPQWQNQVLTRLWPGPVSLLVNINPTRPWIFSTRPSPNCFQQVIWNSFRCRLTGLSAPKHLRSLNTEYVYPRPFQANPRTKSSCSMCCLLSYNMPLTHKKFLCSIVGDRFGDSGITLYHLCEGLLTPLYMVHEMKAMIRNQTGDSNASEVL